MRLLALAIACAACGGSSGPAPAPATRALSIVAPRASDADLEVARVDGRPVWGSCVVAQVARGAPTREAALDQCIAFELMAQAAEHRGLAVDPTVIEATRNALVNRLIETGFEDGHKTPADLGDTMTKFLADNAWRMHRPELRSSSYARVDVAKGASPEVDAHAQALAEKIAAALANETGLFATDLRETAERITQGTGAKLDVSDVGQTPKAGLDPQYAGALFAIPEVGRVSSATRTPWGWDVILWTGGLPSKESTRDEIAAERFPELRRAAMQLWVNQLIKQLGIHIEIDHDLMDRAEGSS